MDLEELQSNLGPPGKGGAFGRFYLQELVNSGGMAEIWIATDPNKHTVALRRLHHSLKFDLTARRRFASGCEILSKIHHHENIISYIEHGTIGLTPYLVMECRKLKPQTPAGPQRPRPGGKRRANYS